MRFEAGRDRAGLREDGNNLLPVYSWAIFGPLMRVVRSLMAFSAAHVIRIMVRIALILSALFLVGLAGAFLLCRAALQRCR